AGSAKRSFRFGARNDGRDGQEIVAACCRVRAYRGIMIRRGGGTTFAARTGHEGRYHQIAGLEPWVQRATDAGRNDQRTLQPVEKVGPARAAPSGRQPDGSET